MRKSLFCLAAALVICALLACGAAMAEFLVSEESTDGRDPGEQATYERLQQELQNGSLVDALNGFAGLGTYQDAVDYTNYTFALLHLRRQNLSEAATGFAALGGFLDAAYQAKLCEAMAVHRFYANGKFGYAALDGSVVIPAAYDWAERVFRDESRMSAGEGVAEESTLLPVAAVFQGTALAGAEDIAPQSGKYGLLRRGGKLIVPISYDEILWTRDGLAAVRDGEKTLLFNLLTGEQLGERYDEAGECGEGLIAVRSGDKWGYLTRAGELLGSGFVWDSALPFSEGLAGVSQNKLAGFIDTAGELVVPLQYQGVRSFGEGLAAVQLKKRWGFINASGAVVIEAAYHDAGVFNQGACAVKKGSKWGLLNQSGETILPFRYNEITDFDPVYHRAWVRYNKLWGLVNPMGEVVLKPTWGTFTPFGCNGIARVSYRGKYGYIDAMGTTCVPNTYAVATPFSAGLAGVADENGQVRYINKFSRGFTIEGNVPTEILCGFIEGRTVRELPPTVEGAQATYEIDFALYAVDGTEIEVKTE